MGQRGRKEHRKSDNPFLNPLETYPKKKRLKEAGFLILEDLFF